MKRAGSIFLFLGIFLTVAIVVVWPRVDFFLLTGHLFPTKIIETLNSPVAVKGWNANGLILSDGREIPLPGVRNLPAESLALSELTKRGVEINSSGEIIGLVRVHHWCGNDAVREHIARVNVAHVLIFLRIGDATSTLPDDTSPSYSTRASYTNYGWNVSEFGEFQNWSRPKELH